MIDTHLHTAEYSYDSVLPVEEAIGRALDIGLDGICVTDHESLGILETAEELTRRFDLLVIPGVEILTEEGDFLAFGLNRLPPLPIGARELHGLLRKRGGFAVAAHPYRDNGRGAGDHLFGLPEPFGVEVYNGRTRERHNLQARETAGLLGAPKLGGSDAHTASEVGRFATAFPEGVRDLDTFIAALRKGEAAPLFRDGGRFLPADDDTSPGMPVVPEKGHAETAVPVSHA